MCERTSSITSVSAGMLSNICMTKQPCCFSLMENNEFLDQLMEKHQGLISNGNLLKKETNKSHVIRHMYYSTRIL